MPQNAKTRDSGLRADKAKKKEVTYVKPKTEGQADYIRAINENDIVLCYGPSGAGKSAVSVGLACQHYLEGKVKKILITRPIVGVSIRNLGSLPGDIREKFDPYLVPVYEEMVKYFGNRSGVDSLIRQGDVEAAPLELMRGRTFNDCFMIADEAQNCTYEQLKMFLTRIGENSKLVVNGDTDQTDLKRDEAGGFTRIIESLNRVTGVGIVQLTQADIVRNPLIKRILGALS